MTAASKRRIVGFSLQVTTRTTTNAGVMRSCWPWRIGGRRLLAQDNSARTPGRETLPARPPVVPAPTDCRCQLPSDFISHFGCQILDSQERLRISQRGFFFLRKLPNNAGNLFSKPVIHGPSLPFLSKFRKSHQLHTPNGTAKPTAKYGKHPLGTTTGSPI